MITRIPRDSRARSFERASQTAAGTATVEQMHPTHKIAGHLRRRITP